MATNHLANAAIILEHAISDYAKSFSISDVPRDQMATMLTAGMNKLRDLPPSQLARLSAGSAAVNEAVRTGFSAVYGSLTEQQRRDMQMRQITGQAAGTAGLIDAKGRILVDGATGYVDRDGRKVDTRERHSSADYERLPSSGATDRNALNFAREIGVDAVNAGFFTGVSSTMRNAVTNFMRSGTAITDDQVRNMNDVSAVIGLVRAGKIKLDDPRLPASVQQIIKDMKAKGIDPATADQQIIRQYLKDHPEALQAAKRRRMEATAATSGLSGSQLVDAVKAQADKAAAAATNRTAKQGPSKPVQTVPRTV